jgi:hypothetical protein
VAGDSGSGAFCHGHRPVISSTVLQLRIVRMAIKDTQVLETIKEGETIYRRD